VIDSRDNCRDVANADQADADGNGKGDACDATGGNSGPGTTKPKKKSGGGCTSAEALPSAAGFLLAGLALLPRRRR